MATIVALAPALVVVRFEGSSTIVPVVVPLPPTFVLRASNLVFEESPVTVIARSFTKDVATPSNPEMESSTFV